MHGREDQGGARQLRGREVRRGSEGRRRAEAGRGGPAVLRGNVTAVTAACGRRAHVPATGEGAAACGGVGGVRGRRTREAAAMRRAVAGPPHQRRVRVP